MATLTKKEHSLYKKLCDEYNDNNYQKICSLDRFLKSKIESCKDYSKRESLQNVFDYAQNDY